MLHLWADPGKAAKLMMKALRDGGLHQQFVDVLKNNKSDEVVRLPGFDLFSRGHTMHPMRWCVPAPNGDEQDLLMAYEDFVSQDLGNVREPQRLASKALRYSSYRVAYFGTRVTRASCWYTPAVKLLAMAQHFPEVSVVREGKNFHTHLGPGYMEVTPQGCWSMFHKRIMPARNPGDSHESNWSVDAFRSRHALAQATKAVEDECDPGFLWAANTILQAFECRRISQDTLMGYFIPSPRKASDRTSAAPRMNPDGYADKTSAAMECEEILRLASGDELVPSLYEAAVPRLCTARTFQRVFGDPYASRARTVRDATRERWLEKVNSMLEGVA